MNRPHPAKKYLREAGISHREIAEYLGLSKSQTTQLLNGKARLTRTRNRQLWELLSKIKSVGRVSVA